MGRPKHSPHPMAATSPFFFYRASTVGVDHGNAGIDLPDEWHPFLLALETGTDADHADLESTIFAGGPVTAALAISRPNQGF